MQRDCPTRKQGLTGVAQNLTKLPVKGRDAIFVVATKPNGTERSAQYMCGGEELINYHDEFLAVAEEFDASDESEPADIHAHSEDEHTSDSSDESSDDSDDINVACLSQTEEKGQR